MCVAVETADIASPAWRPQDVTISVPPGLTFGETYLVVRQILRELGAEQPPESTMEADCFCGEPVAVAGLHPLPPGRIPRDAWQPGGVIAEVARGA